MAASAARERATSAFQEPTSSLQEEHVLGQQLCSPPATNHAFDLAAGDEDRRKQLHATLAADRVLGRYLVCFGLMVPVWNRTRQCD
jgi:hypothetical protein